MTISDALGRVVRSRLFFPLVCLALVLLLNVIVTMSTTGSPGPFFQITLTNGALNGPLITILNRSSELVILAVGMTLVVSCSAGTDISVGAVMALSGAVSIWALGFGQLAQNDYHVKEYVVPYAVGLLVALAVGAVCGAWNGFLVSRLKIQPMVATLILYTGGRGAAKVFADGQIDKVDVANYKWLGNFIQDSQGNNLVPIPTAIFIAAAVVVATALVLRHTALGMNIQSVGINSRASRIVGLKSARIILLAYAFCGVCAAVAGIIATSRIGGIDANNCGKMLELDAILAVALGGNSLAGGKFSLTGSVIGAVTIQALTTVLYSINVSADQLPLYKAIVVVIIVILQSPQLRPLLRRGRDGLKRLLPGDRAAAAA
ncbi:MAG: ABC transporter permease [Propionibacteriaceae bacterium]|jgi:simple sugar transport system permease protein|nr:ABC transporter permease [Propionibacteriaceae bacterium]